MITEMCSVGILIVFSFNFMVTNVFKCLVFNGYSKFISYLGTNCIPDSVLGFYSKYVVHWGLETGQQKASMKVLMQ